MFVNFLKINSLNIFTLCVPSLSVEYLVANKKNPLVLFQSPRSTERRFPIASGEITKGEKQRRGGPGSTPRGTIKL